MTPERTFQVTTEVHKRYPDLPEEVKLKVSEVALRQLAAIRQQRLLDWWEAVAWADSTRTVPNSYLEETLEQRNSRIANNKSRF